MVFIRFTFYIFLKKPQSEVNFTVVEGNLVSVVTFLHWHTGCDASPSNDWFARPDWGSNYSNGVGSSMAEPMLDNCRHVSLAHTDSLLSLPEGGDKPNSYPVSTPEVL